MAVSGPEEELVRRTAALAQLSIDADECAQLGRDFARILASFESLASLEVSGAAPMVRAGGEQAELRADEPAPSLPLDAAMGAAPAREDDFYRVPRTVGGES